MTVVSKKGNMITAESENHTVTRNSSFFKSLKQPDTIYDNSESQGSGSSSSTDKGCIQEPPPVAPNVNAPEPVQRKVVTIPHDQANLPSSSSSVPVPESETHASYPENQPPLRRSTRKRTPRKILDL